MTKYSIYYEDGQHSIHYEDLREERLALMMFQQCVEEGPYHQDILGVELVKWVGEDGEEMETLMYHEFNDEE